MSYKNFKYRLIVSPELIRSTNSLTANNVNNRFTTWDSTKPLGFGSTFGAGSSATQILGGGMTLTRTTNDCILAIGNNTNDGSLDFEKTTYRMEIEVSAITGSPTLTIREAHTTPETIGTITSAGVYQYNYDASGWGASDGEIEFVLTGSTVTMTIDSISLRAVDVGAQAVI